MHTRYSLAEVADWTNPVVRGWMQYYGAFYRSALQPLLGRINAYLMRYLHKKYRRLRLLKKAKAAWQRITRRSRGCRPVAWTTAFW